MNYDDFAPIGGCSRAQHDEVANPFYIDQLLACGAPEDAEPRTGR